MLVFAPPGGAVAVRTRAGHPAHMGQSVISHVPRRVVFLVVCLAIVIGAARPHADEPACAFTGVERIVAVGDVHGAFTRYLEILRTAGIIGKGDRWAGGKAHLVQLGDVVDRGPDSRKVIDFLRRLERDAASAGGRVHYLIGNHEAMRMIGDYRYIVPGEYAAFADGDSREIRQQVIETLAPDVREQALKETPLGMIELVRAFGLKGPYGSYLRTLNAVVRINGVVFLHGGISPAVAPLSVRRDQHDDSPGARRGHGQAAGRGGDELDDARRRPAVVPRPGAGA